MRRTVLNILISFIIAFSLLVIRKVGNISVSPVDAGSLGNFIQVIGTLYGIMAAFIVYIVWDRYNKISEISEKETDSLSELYALVTYLEDDKMSLIIKKSITQYAKTVIEKGWVKLYKGQKSKRASAALHRVYKDIKLIKSNRKRFPVIFGQIISKYEDVSDLRTQRVAMSAEHLPKSLRALIVFDSIALVLSVVLLPYTSFWIALFIVLATTITVVLSLQVIFDLDDPLAPGEWQLTPQAFKDLIEELDERG